MCSKAPVVVLSPGESICKEYDISLRNVKEFVDAGLLEPLGERSFLIYAQTCGTHSQISICAALAVEDCLNGTIKKHENVTVHLPPPGSPVRKSNKVQHTHKKHIHVYTYIYMYVLSCFIAEWVEIESVFACIRWSVCLILVWCMSVKYCVAMSHVMSCCCPSRPTWIPWWLCTKTTLLWTPLWVASSQRKNLWLSARRIWACLRNIASGRWWHQRCLSIYIYIYLSIYIYIYHSQHYSTAQNHYTTLYTTSLTLHYTTTPYHYTIPPHYTIPHYTTLHHTTLLYTTLH